MAGIFDEKCRQKEKYRGEQIRERPFSIPHRGVLPLVVVNRYTKFEVSILNPCKDIFDEKSKEKEKRTNIGKNK